MGEFHEYGYASIRILYDTFIKAGVLKRFPPAYSRFNRFCWRAFLEYLIECMDIIEDETDKY